MRINQNLINTQYFYRNSNLTDSGLLKIFFFSKNDGKYVFSICFKQKTFLINIPLDTFLLIFFEIFF